MCECVHGRIYTCMHVHLLYVCLTTPVLDVWNSSTSNFVQQFSPILGKQSTNQSFADGLREALLSSIANSNATSTRNYVRLSFTVCLHTFSYQIQEYIPKNYGLATLSRTNFLDQCDSLLIGYKAPHLPNRNLLTWTQTERKLILYVWTCMNMCISHLHAYVSTHALTACVHILCNLCVHTHI